MTARSVISYSRRIYHTIRSKNMDHHNLFSFQVKIITQSETFLAYLICVENFRFFCMTDFKFSKMWRNLKFTLYCCNLRYIVAKSVVSRFTRFCVEKNLAKNCVCGKMTNIRSEFSGYLSVFYFCQFVGWRKRLCSGQTVFFGDRYVVIKLLLGSIEHITVLTRQQ